MVMAFATECILFNIWVEVDEKILFADVGEDWAEDEERGTPSDFGFLPRLASKSTFNFFNFSSFSQLGLFRFWIFEAVVVFDVGASTLEPTEGM